MAAPGPSREETTPLLQNHEDGTPEIYNEVAVVALGQSDEESTSDSRNQEVAAALDPGDNEAGPHGIEEDLVRGPRRRRFVPADHSIARNRTRDGDLGLGFVIEEMGDDGVPVVSAQRGYDVVEEDDELTDSDDVESEADSCYCSDESENDLFRPPVLLLPVRNIIVYHWYNYRNR
ncbi:uncharacterized protein [Choristoneura fumiferana]|uniref:uncharacterized protein n=1 Tax=Choristoneura fumiferana TaxID=7141 RepID=UPI003D15A98D